MGLFNSAEEQERKAKLKVLEDKRVAFAQRMAREGFAPEKMLFAQTMNGGFVALGQHEGKYCLVISPGFGTDEDYVMERLDRLQYRVEEVFVKSEGMGGIFGFGKKAEIGREYIITRPDGSEIGMPFVAGRNGWLVCSLAKNPLLKTQRRRGDANVAWDMRPLDASAIKTALKSVAEFFPG